MNPRMKLAYFKREGWPQEWIDAAIECVRNEWERYKPTAQTSSQRLDSDVRNGCLITVCTLMTDTSSSEWLLR